LPTRRRRIEPGRPRRTPPGEEEICYLGQAVVELFVSLTGIHYDRDGWWWDLRYRDLKPIDRASG
jgi:hypothetical protein